MKTTKSIQVSGQFMHTDSEPRYFNPFANSQSSSWSLIVVVLFSEHLCLLKDEQCCVSNI